VRANEDLMSGRLAPSADFPVLIGEILRRDDIRERRRGTTSLKDPPPTKLDCFCAGAFASGTGAEMSLQIERAFLARRERTRDLPANATCCFAHRSESLERWHGRCLSPAAQTPLCSRNGPSGVYWALLRRRQRTLSFREEASPFSPSYRRATSTGIPIGLSRWYAIRPLSVSA
jgi:hypothetical protein